MSMTLNQAITALSDTNYQTLDGLKQLVGLISVEIPQQANNIENSNISLTTQQINKDNGQYQQFKQEKHIMTFVNELIPEEDKQKIDWPKFKWWPSSDPHRPWKWTIDRERDVFLVMLVGRGREDDHPEVYALSWKGEVIRFEAERDGKGMFATGVDMFWKVFNIRIPPHLEGQRQEILNVLREAIDAHGSIYKREQVKSVHIDIT